MKRTLQKKKHETSRATSAYLGHAPPFGSAPRCFSLLSTSYFCRSDNGGVCLLFRHRYFSPHPLHQSSSLLHVLHSCYVTSICLFLTPCDFLCNFVYSGGRAVAWKRQSASSNAVYTPRFLFIVTLLSTSLIGVGKTINKTNTIKCSTWRTLSAASSHNAFLYLAP